MITIRSDFDPTRVYFEKKNHRREPNKQLFEAKPSDITIKSSTINVKSKVFYLRLISTVHSQSGNL